jgi:hypothetical protein
MRRIIPGILRDDPADSEQRFRRTGLLSGQRTSDVEDSADERVSESRPHPSGFLHGLTLRDMKDSLMGAAGSVWLGYQTGKEREVIPLPTQAVDPKSDFTAQFRLTGLKPDTAQKLYVKGLRPEGK